ncbi:hypothetical protein QBC43DRAFT_301545 [Cladorrhinum sp. PSN259]|nr:hypothetical protein QBC43DRAFT_301545 [Cladorrhinum sp. PSN259]
MYKQMSFDNTTGDLLLAPITFAMTSMQITDLCLRYGPVLDTIMSHLSASDASAFLTATDLRSKLSEEYIKKHLDVVNDMPEHADWIRQAIKDGHRVYLAGAGIGMLSARIQYPTSYWRRGLGQDTIVLWLIVLAHHSGSYVNMNGKISVSPEPTGGQHCLSPGCKEPAILNQGILPPPDMWPACSENRLARGWKWSLGAAYYTVPTGHNAKL